MLTLLRLRRRPAPAGAAAAQQQSDLRYLALVFGVVATSLYLVGFVTEKAIGLAPGMPPEGFPTHGIFDRWDALNYIRIAEEGYTGAPTYHVAWFPALPLLMALGRLAALAAALASGVRITGVLLGPALLLEYGQSIGWQWRRVRKDLLWLTVAPLGLVAYMAYLWVALGDPLAFYKAQGGWGRGVGIDLAARLRDDVRLLFLDAPLEAKTAVAAGLAGMVLFVFLLPLLLRYRMRPSYLAFSTVAVLSPLLTGRLVAMNRFILVAFPLFVVLALLAKGHPWLRPVLAVVFLALLYLSTALFATYHWVG